MKLRITRWLALLLVMGCCLFACRKNWVETTEPVSDAVFEVAEARNYFNIKFQKTIPSSSNLRHLAPNVYPMYPHWQKATTFKRKGFSYVEVPTAYTIKSNFLVKPKTPGQQAEYHAGKYPVQGIQRLLIFQDKNGKIGEMNINYIPDEEYLASKGNDISENRLHKIDPGYSGFIIYSRTNTSLLFMTRIEKGKFGKSFIFNPRRPPCPT